MQFMSIAPCPFVVDVQKDLSITTHQKLVHNN